MKRINNIVKELNVLKEEGLLSMFFDIKTFRFDIIKQTPFIRASQDTKDRFINIIWENYGVYVLKIFLRFLRDKGLYEKYMQNLNEQCIKGGWGGFYFSSPKEFFIKYTITTWISAAFPWDGKKGETTVGDFTLWLQISELWRDCFPKLKEKILY
jgi:hypothetical protein